MLISGTRKKHIQSIVVEEETCSNCNFSDSLVFFYFTKYIHFFWIPTFSLGIEGYSECSNCKNVLLQKDMQEDLKEVFLFYMKENKSPLWSYSGLLILALFFSVAIFVLPGYNHRKNLSLIYESEVGDIYRYEVEEKVFSCMRVDSISSDSLYFTHNDLEIGKKSKMYKIDKEENYTNDLVKYSKSDILVMYQNEILFSVARNN